MKRFLLLSLFLPALSAADVRYTLEPLTEAKSIRVAINLDDAKATETFNIPAWTPGMYVVMDFQDKISDVKATDPSGKLLAVKKTEKRKWVVDNPEKTPITFSYRVLGDDLGLGFFRVNVKYDKVFVNGASAFMYVDGRLQEKATLKLKIPNWWDVATGMEPSLDGYVAQDYDELIDHPLQLGSFKRAKFEVGGIPFEAVFVSPDGKYRCDVNAEAERLRKLSAPTLKMFGGAPFKRYVYIVHLAVGDFSGGLEHRASNVIATSNINPLGVDELATHEYVHAWNVKQIRPAVLGPFDYSKPVRTGNLWFAEGVTDYYGYKHTYASGLHGKEWLLSSLTAQVADYESGNTRLTKTVEDASRENWENGGFSVGDLSYYTKGLLIGWIFDAVIRSSTHGEKSLDDVMRLLYAKHKMPNPGYGEDDLIAAVNKVADRDLTQLYKDMVRSTKPLPYELLAEIGLKVVRPSAQSGPSAARFAVIEDPDASALAVKRRSEWLAR